MLLHPDEVKKSISTYYISMNNGKMHEIWRPNDVTCSILSKKKIAENLRQKPKKRIILTILLPNPKTL